MIRAIFTAPVLAVLLSGCIPDKLNTDPEVRGLEGAAPMQTLTELYEQTEVTLRPGGEVEVLLDANPTTGYQWSLMPGWDEQVIRLTDQSYKADPVPLGVVGSGGVSRFAFEGIAPGRTEVRLAYISPGGHPVDTRTLRITVVK